MALSKWYADIVLPGKRASAFSRCAEFSTDFNLDNEEITDKISYYLNCDSVDSVDNPKFGKTKKLIVSGYKNLVEAEVSKFDLIVNVNRATSLTSSSNSHSSSSESLSSESMSSSSNCNSSSGSSESLSSYCWSSSGSSSLSFSSESSSNSLSSESFSSQSLSSQSLSSQSRSSNSGSWSSQSMSSQSLSSQSGESQSFSSNSSESADSNSSSSAGDFPGPGWYCVGENYYSDEVCETLSSEGFKYSYIINTQEYWDLLGIGQCLVTGPGASEKRVADGPYEDDTHCYVGFQCITVHWGATACDGEGVPFCVTTDSDLSAYSLGQCIEVSPGFFRRFDLGSTYSTNGQCLVGCPGE